MHSFPVRTGPAFHNPVVGRTEGTGSTRVADCTFAAAVAGSIAAVVAGSIVAVPGTGYRMVAAVAVAEASVEVPGLLPRPA